MKLFRKALVLFILLALSISTMVFAETSIMSGDVLNGQSKAAAKSYVYRLEPECAPGKCLDVQWAANADGTPVWLWPTINTYAQLWWFYYQSDGTYKIVPQCGISTPGVTRCLDVSGGGSADGTAVQIWTDNGSAAQRWNLYYMDNGYYEIEPACAPGMRLDVQWSGSADQTPIWIWTRNGGSAQRWKIVAIDPLSYYTTCVNDGLNPSDRVAFENQFNALGYTNYGYNTDVSATSLNTLLGGTYTTLYHTGHGYNSGINTSSGGSLSVGNVTSINVQNFICATCLTLTSTAWTSKMGTNCQNVLGYTNLSWDYPTDDNVVERLANVLRGGWSYIQAWYNANVAESSLADRWCGYVREGSSIVEYSARTGNNPKSAASLPMESLTPAGNVKAATNLLSDERTFNAQFSKILNSDIFLNGDREGKSEFYQVKSPGFLEKTPMSEAEAVAIAQVWLGNNLPSDAKLDKVTAIETAVDNQAKQVVGYIVRYIRQMDGLSFRTNGVDDHIALLVNGNSVIAMSQVWPEIKLSVKAYTSPKANILSVSKVIKLAGAQIATIAKSDSPIEIIDVTPCYGIIKNGVVPAYELLTSQGPSIIVDATTARLIN